MNATSRIKSLNLFLIGLLAGLIIIIAGAVAFFLLLPDEKTCPPDCQGVNFSNQDLSGGDFRRTDFTDANLSNANLTGAILTNSILVNTNLTSANLTGAILLDSNMTNTNLKNADLTKAIVSLPLSPAIRDQAGIRAAIQTGDADLLKTLTAELGIEREGATVRISGTDDFSGGTNIKDAQNLRTAEAVFQSSNKANRFQARRAWLQSPAHRKIALSLGVTVCRGNVCTRRRLFR